VLSIKSRVRAPTGSNDTRRNELFDMAIDKVICKGRSPDKAVGEERQGQEFQPPHPPDYEGYGASLYLAGTMEMGKSTGWQRELVNDLVYLSVAILNPLRGDWDPAWPQDPDFIPFRAHVTWELDGLDKADVVALYLEAEENSVISLLELGKLALQRPEEVVVCCSKGYHKWGNVMMMVQRYSMCSVETYDEMVEEVRKRLEEVITQRSRGSVTRPRSASRQFNTSRSL
jgi:hypothetical protein